MKSYFDPGAAEQFRARIANLRTDSRAEWGRMSPAQALAHLTGGVELTLGEQRPPRMLIGRLLGGVIRRLALGDDKPMRRNSPTVPGLVVSDQRELDRERERLYAALDRLSAAGPAGCTTHPHSFFGRLTPDEWGILTYKHLDHHLRQFGV